MPRKSNFEKDLTTIAVRRKDYDRFKTKRHGNEPMYSTVRRVLDNSDANELETWLNEAQQNVQKWRERALKAEEKLEKLGKMQQVLEILN